MRGYGYVRRFMTNMLTEIIPIEGGLWLGTQALYVRSFGWL